MKVIHTQIIGPLGSGKTLFFNTVHDLASLTPHPTRTSSMTPVGQQIVRYIRLTINATITLYLYDFSQGQGSYRPVAADILETSVDYDDSGAIVVIDGTKPETYRRAKSDVDYLCMWRINSCVALNKHDFPVAWSVEKLRWALRTDEYLPIIPCNVNDRESVKRVLLALCEENLKWGNGSDES